MRLTSREKFLIVVLLIIGLGAAFFNWVYTPYQARIDTGAQQLAKLEAEHDKLVRWQAEVPQTEIRLVEVQTELDGWVKEARAVSDTPLAIVFWQAQAAAANVRLTAVRLSGTQASLTFTAPSYPVVRNFLLSMEKMVAFEVLKARYAVPAGSAVDGSFDIRLHIGAANEATANPATTDQNPFVR
jgi:Tfp pilus assembly protein PilN